jgi:TRAP-type C4-dicarboxylate transport system substrate-binding protein
MKMRKSFMVMMGLVFCCVLIFGTLSNPVTAKAGPIILKFSVAIPPGDPMVEGLNPWIKNFNEAAKGQYELKLFPGGTLAGTADTLDAVRTGVVEVGHGSIPTFAGHHPAFSASEVPYLLESYEANVEFVRSIQDYQNKIMEKMFNQKLLCTWCMGFNEFYTAKKPVKTLADMKGLNVAVTAPLMARSAQLLGASPVTMDWPDEFQSLQKGVVDAGMATVSGALAFMKYWEVIKYYVVSCRAGGQLDVAMNLDAYNKMPANLQKVMDDEAEKYARAMDVAMKDFSFVWAIGELKKNGVDVYTLPPEERAKWKQACAPIAEDYWKQMGADADFLKEAAAKANTKYPYKD